MIVSLPWVVPVLAAEAAPPGSGLLRLDPGLMVWTWVSFFLVLYLLGRYAYRPMLFLVQQREKRIQESLAKAEEARRRAEEAAAEREKILLAAQEEARKVIASAREAAEAQRRRIIDEAREDAARILAHAEQEIAIQGRNAMEDLADTIADLAVEAASRILHEELDPQRHRALIDRVIAEMERGGG